MREYQLLAAVIFVVALRRKPATPETTGYERMMACKLGDARALKRESVRALNTRTREARDNRLRALRARERERWTWLRQENLFVVAGERILDDPWHRAEQLLRDTTLLVNA